MTTQLARAKAASARVVAAELKSLVDSWESRWRDPLNFESHDEFLYKRRYYVRQLNALAKRANSLFLYQAARSIAAQIAEVDREVEQKNAAIAADPEAARRIVIVNEEALSVLTLQSVPPPTSLHFEPTASPRKGARPETAPMTVLPPIVRERKHDAEWQEANMSMEERITDITAKCTTALNEGEFEAALKLSERVIGINPLHVEGLRLQGSALQALGRPDDANTIFLRADRVGASTIFFRDRAERAAEKAAALAEQQSKSNSPRSLRRPPSAPDSRGGEGAASSVRRPGSALRTGGGSRGTNTNRPDSARSVHFPPPGQEGTRSRPGSVGSAYSTYSRPSSRGSVGSSSIVTTVTTKADQSHLLTFRGKIVPGALPLCDHRVCCARTRHPRRVAAWASRVCHDCEGCNDGDPRRIKEGLSIDAAALAKPGVFYCDVCYAAMHPWVRTAHDWTPTKPHVQPVDWNRYAVCAGINVEIARLKRVDKVVAEARKLPSVVKASENHPSTMLRLRGDTESATFYRHVRRTVESTNQSLGRIVDDQQKVQLDIAPLRDQSRRWTKHTAAKMIQKIGRRFTVERKYAANAAMQRMHAHNLERKSALKLQQCFRIKKAREEMQAAALDTFEKEIDNDTGRAFWYNKHLGISTWTKPRSLGAADAPLVEVLVDKSESEHASSSSSSSSSTTTKIQREPRVFESDEEAARVLQAMYRTKLARDRIRGIAMGTFEKVFDEDTEAFFYFNKTSGTSTWVKPKSLGSADVAVVVEED